MKREHARLQTEKKTLQALKVSQQSRLICFSLICIVFQVKVRAQPSYWEHRLAAKNSDGFALLAVSTSEWSALTRFLDTDSAQLGRGRDVAQPEQYNQLKLARAWRLEHPALWEKYTAGKQQVCRDMGILRKANIRSHSHQTRSVRTERATARMPSCLDRTANEVMLLHGTSPEVLLSILSTGPNERFSGTNAGTAFGDGTYFAEDIGKTDQYVTADANYNSKNELHKRLYKHTRHPGKVYYTLVCRVSLGHVIRTQTFGRGSKSMDDAGVKVFPIGKRELAAVPRVSPPVHHHALVAELGGNPGIERFREFVVFHSEYIYPEYLIAYQRQGRRGPI